MKSVTRQCRVQNSRGIHCRVAARLAEIVNGLDVVVEIVNDGEGADLSSVLDVLSLGLGPGAVVSLRGRGPDAKVALDGVEQVLLQREDPSIR